MYHRWKIILGQLVYCGKYPQLPNDYKSQAHDFVTEDKVTPHTVFIRIAGQLKVPVFHPQNDDHAQRLKNAHTLQSDYTYETV